MERLLDFLCEYEVNEIETSSEINVGVQQQQKDKFILKEV